MANERFDPLYSSDNIWRADDGTRCVTDDLNAIEGNISSLQSGKAASNHTHTPSSIGAAAASHSHVQSEITGLTDALNQKAPSNHTHANKADLVNGKIPISQIPDEVKEIRIVANIAARNALTGLFAGLNVYVTDASADSTVTSGGAYYLYDGSGWIKTSESESMDAIVQWANIQGKPSSMPANGGNAETVGGKSPSDFATASHTHTQYAAAGHTHTASDVGAAAASHTHTQYAAAGHTHTASDVGAAAASHTHTQYAASGHTHSVATESSNGFMGKEDRVKLNGIAQNANNYTHPSSHPASIITGLSAVATSGKYSDLSGKPTIPTIPSSLPANGGNADTVDNKHASDFALASHTHDYAASSHTHSYDSLTGKPANPGIIWSKDNGTGGLHMAEGHTVNPSKALSACRVGWLLIWSDWNSDGTAGDYDFAVSIIPKFRPNGTTWSGQLWLCQVPNMVNATSPLADSSYVKALRIYDNKIMGHVANNQGGRDDIVLRAIMEI